MDYLQNIIEHKRKELEKSIRARPLEVIKDGLNYLAGLSLKKSLLDNNPAIIAEMKQKSPSKGYLRAIENPVEIAKTFESSGAAALSVLTDHRFFGGALEDLKLVKQHTALPVLRKDFIIDTYQVYESKYYGADAILLITSCLEKNQLVELLYAAESIGLEALVEVESEHDIAKLDGIKMEIIGVNNRNLHTFEQTIETSYRLYDSLPSSAVKISESALSNPQQLVELYKTGFHGFLIGESLMRTGDPGKTLETFINEFRANIHEKNTH